METACPFPGRTFLDECFVFGLANVYWSFPVKQGSIRTLHALRISSLLLQLQHLRILLLARLAHRQRVVLAFEEQLDLVAVVV